MSYHVIACEFTCAICLEPLPLVLKGRASSSILDKQINRAKVIEIEKSEKIKSNWTKVFGEDRSFENHVPTKFMCRNRCLWNFNNTLAKINSEKVSKNFQRKHISFSSTKRFLEHATGVCLGNPSKHQKRHFSSINLEFDLPL